MAPPTPSPRPGPPPTPQGGGLQTPLRTPASKHRLHFPATTPKNAHHGGGVGAATEHPVEVIGRIRNLSSGGASALEIAGGGTAVRVRGDAGGCRDFTLDGVSVSEEEDLEGFYRRFVRSRIEGVRVGAKCTVMVYGPTGSGKSHTMFGCAKQPGIVYRALRDILDGGGGEGDSSGGGGDDDAGFGAGLFVQVAVLEIYNEEIYDLLARLEVMGKKAKNATYISGNEAGKISREVAKVEKRRIVKTKINQGNTALKRVVESIANGDSHVPFRDSKLTMLLQDSFEDDKSKILMILCASPDPKELHKTVSTLEYGAKAKCIIRAAHAATPRDKMSSEESSTMLNSRIVAMNQFIYKLQKENKLREKERNEAQNVLRLKEEELTQLRAKLKLIEMKEKAAKEEEINSKVMEKTHTLRSELMKMEEAMLRQQQELAALKQRLQEVEREKADAHQPVQQDLIGGRLLARLSEMPAGLDQSMSMVMSMELDVGDQPQDVKVIKEDTRQQGHISNHTATAGVCTGAVVQDVRISGYPEKVVLSTVFEEGDEEDAERDNGLEEVCKEVVEESFKVDITQHALAEPEDPTTRKHRIENIFRLCGNHRELAKKPKVQSQVFGDENKSPAKHVFGEKSKSPAKKAFGDENKEPSTWGAIETPMCDVRVTDSPVSSQLSPIVCQVVDEPLSEQLKSCSTVEESDQNKENSVAGQKEKGGLLEVYIKWESGNLIKGLKLLQNSCLSDLRKLIEAHFEETGNKQQHQFTFLLLGDPSGAPVSREKEASVQISKLPHWNNQPDSYLACLRAAKKPAVDHMPFSPLDSKLNSVVKDGRLADVLSPKVNPMSPNYIRELRA
ncbi:hypothetical protein BAE44_0000575 [Dichanthelium oligosanthes]|uniref:Kinesin motor domain-containing protein n=1 Tax=Dichanthelium oligosanthes TaxID=888268 RepID=A0A1E5WLZ3_9POAL|nr:hypothetical protein BAE44_0000575 [Dichanthelium oligosanthes]